VNDTASPFSAVVALMLAGTGASADASMHQTEQQLIVIALPQNVAGGIEMVLAGLVA
jgi:hypothetical protein